MNYNIREIKSAVRSFNTTISNQDYIDHYTGEKQKVIRGQFGFIARQLWIPKTFRTLNKFPDLAVVTAKSHKKEIIPSMVKGAALSVAVLATGAVVGSYVPEMLSNTFNVLATGFAARATLKTLYHAYKIFDLSPRSQDTLKYEVYSPQHGLVTRAGDLKTKMAPA